MSRIIKFRAWDKELKQMFYSDDCFFCFQNGGLIERDGESSSFGSKNDIVMQYIGLKDKLGRKIYEGDIVISFDTGNKPAVIECDAPDGGFNIRDLDGEYIEIDSNTIMEVIGNIYQGVDDGG